jgi:hypothetical protein
VVVSLHKKEKIEIKIEDPNVTHQPTLSLSLSTYTIPFSVS